MIDRRRFLATAAVVATGAAAASAPPDGARWPMEKSEVESLRLFDANCSLGASDLSIDSAPVSAPRLIAEMDRLGIAEALVYHSFAAGYAPVQGNQQLMREVAGFTRLRPCWVTLPHHTAETPPPRAFVEQLRATRARAVRIFPPRHRFSLSKWSVDPLLEALAEHKIPLFLDFDRRHWGDDVVDYDHVFRICEQFRRLPVILVREGLGSSRFLYPLLEKLDNLFIEISYYQPSGGLEDISKRFGVKKLIFGTGLPIYSPGPAMALFLCADLSFEQKKAIAGDNLRDLLREGS